MSRAGDLVLRFLGADPEVFRPMYRARLQIVRRQSRIVRAKNKDNPLAASPFRTLCFFSAMYGLIFVFLGTINAVLPGAGIAIVLGCSFLLLIVMTEHFDVLVDPREATVLAAHPHDDRSFLLAKLAVIGRSLAILAAFLFVPLAVALGFRLSPAAFLAFLAGAAGAVVGTGAAGMLLAALILRLAGRKAMERLMPWVQVLFQIGYFAIIGSGTVMKALVSPGSSLETLLWCVPPLWFLSPLEIATGGPSPGPLTRLLLAAAVLALLLLVATRWLGEHLGERLLEPVETSIRKKAAPRRGPLRPARGDRGRLLALLRVHLRSDWRTRSELLVTPLLVVVWLVVMVRQGDGGRAIPLTFVGLYAWLLLLSAHTLTRSSRPDTLWFILVSPIDRVTFSLGTVPLLRVLLLAPALAGVVWLELRSTDPLPHRLVELLMMLALGDLMLVLGKGLFPEFPFSQLSHAEGSAGGQRTSTLLVSGLITGLATGAVALLDLTGTPGLLGGAALFALLRLPVAAWARKRTATATERLELAALTAAG